MVLCHELLVTLSPAPIKRKNTRSFWQRRCFAGFAAETQAPIMMAHQTKLSPTACTAVLQFGHEACDAFLRSNGCKLPESRLKVYRSNDIAQATASSPGRPARRRLSRLPEPSGNASGFVPSMVEVWPDRPNANTSLRSDDIQRWWA